MCWGSADPHITLSQGSAEGVLSFPHSYDEDVMMMMMLPESDDVG